MTNFYMQIIGLICMFSAFLAKRAPQTRMGLKTWAIAKLSLYLKLVNSSG